MTNLYYVTYYVSDGELAPDGTNGCAFVTCGRASQVGDVLKRKGRYKDKEYLVTSTKMIREYVENTESVMDEHLAEVGMSAYQLAVKNGYNGTEEEWLNAVGGGSFNSTSVVYSNANYSGSTVHDALDTLMSVGAVGSNIPVLTEESYDALPDAQKPSDYILVNDGSKLSEEAESTFSLVEHNTSYMNVMFSALRSLQAEVTRLKNAFTYGINSYNDSDTALSALQSGITEVDKEPLWAMEPEDLTSLASMNIGMGCELLPANYLDLTTEGIVKVSNTATYTVPATVMSSTDMKQIIYITSNSNNISFVLKGLNGEDPFTFSLAALNLPTVSNYRYMVVISRTQTVNSITYGKNYVYVIITNAVNGNTIAEGYISSKGALKTNEATLSARYTVNTISFTNLELTECNIYSKYQDFSNEVISSAPTEEDYKYKVAHLTIRLVDTKDRLDAISSQLQAGELAMVEATNTLYIKKRNGVMATMGATSSSGGSSSTGTETDNNMTNAELRTALQQMGLISLDASGNLKTPVEMNSIGDITFVHSDTGKAFKVSIDAEGNLISRECETSNMSTRVSNAAFTQTDSPDLYRGFFGRLHMAENNKDNTKATLSNTSKTFGLLADRVRIGSFYAPLSTDVVFGCSHSYIELENTSDEDINLDGFYFYYAHIKDDTNVVDKLALEGILPAGGTFLIRGAQHAQYDDANCFIKVESYDMEWYIDGSLLDLTISPTEGRAFAITYGDQSLSYTTQLWASNSDSATKDNAPTLYMWYFVDAFVFGTQTATVANIQNGSGTNYWATTVYAISSNSILRNTFELDPAKQAFQGLSMYDSSRYRWKTADDVQTLKLDKEYIEFPKTDEKCAVANFTPKASFEGKNVCTDKTKMDLGKPNMVTCSFGINTLTTRCFNWVSAGLFDEYVFIKQSDGTYKKFSSYTASDASDTYTPSSYPSKKLFNSKITNAVYKRMTGRFPADNTLYTAHKCILDIVASSVSTPTTYTYVVGRADKNGNPDSEHISDEMTFTLYPSTYKPLIFQTTDQQGFHWIEYQAWAAAAEKINDEIDSAIATTHGGYNVYPVLLNTGDMTQNGTRVNEWLDYYNAGKCLFNHLEQMNVVGNNDLCGTDYTILGTGDDEGKSNAYYFHVFYCYEVNPVVAPIYTGSDSVARYIPSLYYFGDGTNYMLMVNSEITSATCANWFKATSTNGTVNIYTGFNLNSDSSKVSYQVNANSEKYVYEQLYYILNTVLSGKTVIAACHEMPFTVITKENLLPSVSSATRSLNGSSLVGSHLNELGNTDLKGTYWFSRLLEKFGIKLCLGGHKHTYSCTYRLKENVASTVSALAETLQNDNYSRTDYITETIDGTSYNISLTKKPYICETVTLKSDASDVIYPGISDASKTGVIYFMCQATGYKLKSNKELPSPNQIFSKLIPQTSYKSDGSAQPNTNQLYPMYAVIDVPAKTVELIRIKGIGNTSGTTFAFKQGTYSSDAMTLEYASFSSSVPYYGEWKTTETSLISNYEA